LKWFAILIGSDSDTPSTHILLTVSFCFDLPNISFKVSQVFFGFFAFSVNLDVKYNFFAPRSTRKYTALNFLYFSMFSSVGLATEIL
jgi:hypothetical protein